MKNLISMTDFVSEQRKTHEGDFEDLADLYYRYAKFLKQPLELWMFVPCDEDGNALEKLKTNFHDGITNNDRCEIYNLYQQEKERCLFDGFEVLEDNDGEKVILGDYTCLKISDLQNLYVEYLTKYNNIKLSQTAIKQLGL